MARHNSIVVTMTKVIKSYEGSSLPTGHKRPLIYNLSGCAWLKSAGIPLRLATAKVASITAMIIFHIILHPAVNIYVFYISYYFNNMI